MPKYSRVKFLDTPILAGYNRHEEFALELEIEANRLNESEIKELQGSFDCCHLRDGDAIILKFSFYVNYLDGITKMISLMLALLDRSVVKSVKTGELEYGKCLAQELFCKLEQIEKKLEEE